MQASLSGFIEVARFVTALCLLILASTTHADGMRTEQGSDAASAPVSEHTPSDHYCQPRVNHPFILLDDGRLVVAGGMATVNTRFDRNIGANTEIWNPLTGQWRELAKELRFDADQKVYLNQLQDGRVLFFIVRERVGYEKPEYQVKVWDPFEDDVKIISPNIKPRHDTDITVMRDGRVLFINGNYAGADLWDSGNNTLAHHKVTGLENYHWQALSLRNGQILAVTEFQDQANAANKGIRNSAVLLWDTQSDAWKALASLPVPFLKSAVLLELKDGSVLAKVLENQFQLPTLDKTWIATDKEMQPLLCRDSAALKTDQALAAPGVPAQHNAATSKPAAEAEISWRDTVAQVMSDNKWLLLAIVIPLLLYSNVRRLNERQQETFLKYANRILRFIAFFIFIYLILAVLWALGNTMLRGTMFECGPYQHDSKSEKIPFEELKKFVSCVDNKNGLLERILFYKTKKRVASIPYVPCRYVGQWMSTRSFGKFKIKLTDDSRFAAESLQGNQGVVSAGSWAVVGDEILWFYDGRSDPFLTYEANPILSEGMREFTLAEENGEHTVFELLEPIKSSNCK